MNFCHPFECSESLLELHCMETPFLMAPSSAVSRQQSENTLSPQCLNLTPLKVDSLAGKDVVHVSCSAYNTVFLTGENATPHLPSSICTIHDRPVKPLTPFQMMGRSSQQDLTMTANWGTPRLLRQPVAEGQGVWGGHQKVHTSQYGCRL